MAMRKPVELILFCGHCGTERRLHLYLYRDERLAHYRCLECGRVGTMHLKWVLTQLVLL